MLPKESLSFTLSEITSVGFSDKYLTTKDICCAGMILQGGKNLVRRGKCPLNAALGLLLWNQ